MLKILKHIMQRVKAARDIEEALQVMVQGARAALETQACSIYLVDREREEFVLVATEGLAQEAVGKARVKFGEGLLSIVSEREELVNVDHAAQHPRFCHIPMIEEESYKAFLAVPVIHHRQLLAIFVAQETAERCFDDSAEALLLTIGAQLSEFIARAQITGELKKFLGHHTLTHNSLLTGISAVHGVALGQAVVIYPLADLEAVPMLNVDNIEEEIIDFETALQAVRDEMMLLNQRLSPSLPEKERALFDAYLRMLDPESLGDAVIQEIKAGVWAQGALKKVVKHFVSEFEAMDNEYMRERSADVLDIGQRVLAHLQRSEQKELRYPARTILMGDQLSAAHLAAVPDDRLVGLVCSTGSKSSHMAIFAKAMNVPTVLNVGALSLAELEGVEVIVDGYYGQVYLSPTASLKEEYQYLVDKEEALDEALEYLQELPAQTLDGYTMSLYVNTGFAHDMGLSLSVGADGVGLYRSEIPFLTHDRFPSAEEQRVIYRQLLSTFAPRPVIMRVLDIGGDKTLPYFPIEEENPFLGWRGIRVLLDYPHIFLVQLRAMLRASEGFDNLSIMLPMVTDLSELTEAQRLFDKAYHDVLSEGRRIQKPKFGVMIEVPSAVYLAQQFAERVDFLSVGSNDLTQYMLAVDRNNTRISALFDYLHPAVLAALQYVVTCAHNAKCAAYVCGEMASDPLGVVLLLGMGYTGLSMHAHSLPRMKSVIRQFTLEHAKQLVTQVMQLDTSAKIRSHIEKVLEDLGLSSSIRVGH